MNQSEALMDTAIPSMDFPLITGSPSPGNLSMPDPRSLWGSAPLSYSLIFWDLEPGTVALLLLYCLSFLVGLAGNVLSLRVLLARGRLPGGSATRKLLVNLAVCDMMVICVCMPVNLGHQLYRAWVFGSLLCRAVPFVQAVAVSGSVLTLAGISLNRYYSVHRPLHARATCTSRRTSAMVAAVWSAAAGLCLPLLFMNSTRRLELLGGRLVLLVCAETWPDARLRQAYNLLLFCALYGFPVAFNLVICFLTGRRLWGAPEHLEASGGWAGAGAGAGSRLTARRKVAQMVLALVLLFTLSWLPLYVVDLWLEFNGALPEVDDMEEPDLPQHPWVLQLRPFAQWLGLTNSALNPLCYCFVGSLYRSAVRFRDSYRQRFASVFSLSAPPEDLAAISGPRLLAYRGARAEAELSRRKDYSSCTQLLCKGRSPSSGTACETTVE
ncbi:QRFP-like peptide receptor [Ambystoma mexicanum]|uniref:QRFP-like peptide receptor n=1 Tax=Ambystoma mexicanum TaxID=8296 RepID=UPI0037E8FFAE